MSLYTFLIMGPTPVGGAFTGFVANALDIGVALQIKTAVCLVGLGLAAVFLRRATLVRELRTDAASLSG